MNAFQKWSVAMDSNAAYWTQGSALFLVAMALVFAPAWLENRNLGRPKRQRLFSHPALFFLALLLMLFGFRWPPLFASVSLNPDESQLIAQAITLSAENPFEWLVFYRTLQSGSAGPLLTYPLLIPGFFGLDINYITARIVLLFILWGSGLCLYFTVRLVAGETRARLAALACLLTFSLGHSKDFIHYSSESVSIPLIAIACYLFFRYRSRENRHPERILFLLGIVLGALPFAKLQAVIIGLAIAVLAYLFIALAKDAGRNTKFRRAGALTLGGITLPALFLGLYAVTGVFSYFWKVYIVNNYHYRQRGDSFFEIMSQYLRGGEGLEPVDLPYRFFLIGASILAIVSTVIWIRDRPHRKERPWSAMLFALGVTAASFWAVAAPGRPFPHYLLLAVIPTALLCGVFMTDPRPPANAVASGKTKKSGNSPALSALSTRPWGILVSLPCLFVLAIVAVTARCIEYPKKNYSYAGELQKLIDFRKLPASQVINQLKRPGDTLTVWGWCADYHVETGLPMGTRSAVAEFQIRDWPLRDFYRAAALEEFRMRIPVFFVDAVGPFSLEFKDVALYGIETFPELHAFIKANYTYVGYKNTVQHLDRLFLRNDRYREAEATESRLTTEPPADSDPAPGLTR